MNIKDMRQLPDEELRAEMEKTRDKVFRMRFQGRGKDLENPGLLGALKKDVARLETVLSERRLRVAERAATAANAPATVPEAAEASAKGEGDA